MGITMNHTGFVVSDLERSVRFYRDGLGLEVDRELEADAWELSQVVGYEKAHIKVVMLIGDDGHVLELIQYVNPPAAAHDPAVQHRRAVTAAAHIAFFMEDVEEVYQRLLSMGGQKLNPPVEAMPGLKACYFQDPDGNWIELLEDKVHSRSPFRIRQNIVKPYED